MQNIQSDEKPKVGVGIMILKDSKVLIAKRKSSHGDGEYAFPGGHLEYMESIEECAKRETLEECGIKIKNVKFLFLLNLKKYIPKHYVHIGLIAEWESGEPQNLEQEKSENWDWYELDKIPKPFFETIEFSLEAYNTDRNYFDF